MVGGRLRVIALFLKEFLRYSPGSLATRWAHAMRQITMAEISNGGERMTHLWKNDCYYAHLSVYAFALPLMTGRRVLDGGSGAGYGAAWLADNGVVEVNAVEFEELAVDFSRQHFGNRENLNYRQGSIESLPHIADQSLEAIFSSNVIEHVPNPCNVFYEFARILKPGGDVLIAVPPVTCKAALELDLTNPHHLHHWTPRQWVEVMSRYFNSVMPIRHTYVRDDIVLDFANTPEQTRVSEHDFVFLIAPLDELYTKHTFSAVFIVRDPKPLHELPPHGTLPSFAPDSAIER